jgi:hypothetical protein
MAKEQVLLYEGHNRSVGEKPCKDGNALSRTGKDNR